MQAGPNVTPAIDGNLFDGSPLSHHVFHQIMIAAASDQPEALQIISEQLLTHVVTMNWDYFPTEYTSQGDDKTPLWFLTHAAKQNQALQTRIMNKLLTKEFVTRLDWNAASRVGVTQGITPLWLVLAGHLENQAWANIALQTLLNGRPINSLDWLTVAKAGPGAGRTPLSMLEESVRRTPANKPILDAVKRNLPAPAPLVEQPLQHRVLTFTVTRQPAATSAVAEAAVTSTTNKDRKPVLH